MAENMNQNPDLSEQEQIRRDKLRVLQEAGKDPYQIRRFDVDIHSQEIKDRFDEGRLPSAISRTSRGRSRSMWPGI